MQGFFLDRDGVINCERADYVKTWDEFTFLPNVLPALRRLATLNLPIVVISNQSAIGRGLVARATVDAIHQQAQAIIAEAGGRVDDFFVCPHHPALHCACRKPQPGLLEQAAARFKLDLPECLFIGDAITDFQAAKAAGCQSILVKSGRQGAQLQQLMTTDNPAPIVADLAAAVELILSLEQRNYV
ncbi:MAG: HAD family hydrolase [Chloroflexi bacterium]|nr:HAD family hydrolase [Chloroflexota bacterium]